MTNAKALQKNMMKQNQVYLHFSMRFKQQMQIKSVMNHKSKLKY